MKLEEISEELIEELCARESKRLGVCPALTRKAFDDAYSKLVKESGPMDPIPRSKSKKKKARKKKNEARRD